MADLKQIQKALQADPDAQYGDLAPIARGGKQDYRPEPKGPGAPPWDARPDPGQIRFALPTDARRVLQGLLGLSRKTAGEVPAGQNLGQREIEALMGFAAPSLASRPSPSSLVANFGGKRHERNLRTGLWHGAKDNDELGLSSGEIAQQIAEEGFTRGSSAELGIKGTSLSDDPSISLQRFAKGEPEGMLKVDPQIDASEVFNLRPSAYAAKDYQQALPKSTFKPGPEASGVDTFKTMKDINQDLPGELNINQVEPSKYEVIDEGAGSVVLTDETPEGAVKQLFDMGEIDQSTMDKITDKLLSKPIEQQPENFNSPKAVSEVLKPAGITISEEPDGTFALDADDGEMIDGAETLEGLITKLASNDTITGSQQDEALSAIGIQTQSGAAGSADEGGAALVAKPQSYYRESEYFAPKETGGQKRLQAKRVAEEDLPEGAKTQLGSPHIGKSRSAPSTLSVLQESLKESRPLRAQRRDVGKEIANRLEASRDPLNSAFNAAFFPKQQEALEKARGLAQRALGNESQGQLDIDQGNLERPGSALDAPVRKRVDDRFRKSTQALEEMRRVLEKAAPQSQAVRKKADQKLSSLRNSLRHMTLTGMSPVWERLPNGHPLKGESPAEFRRNAERQALPNFVRSAGEVYSTPDAFVRDLGSYIQNQGPEPLLEAIVRQDPAEAVTMLKQHGGRAQLESDDPNDLIE